MRGPSGIEVEIIRIWQHHEFTLDRIMDNNEKEITKFHERVNYVSVGECHMKRMEFFKEKENSTWRHFIELIQETFRTGEVPKEWDNVFMILIPKPKSEKLRGIGIIDVMWKIMAYIIKRRLESKIKLHQDIHGFRAGHGTRTEIFHNKIWANYQHNKGRKVIQSFFDIKESYKTVDQDKLLMVL